LPVPFYIDVHVPRSITDQLRRRGVDVVTATKDGWAERDDTELLEHAQQLGRVVFTQDIRFKALAENWQRHGRSFAGLVFGHQLGGTIGQFVRDLEVIATASEPEEWENTIEHLPFQPGMLPAGRDDHSVLTWPGRRPIRRPNWHGRRDTSARPGAPLRRSEAVVMPSERYFHAALRDPDLFSSVTRCHFGGRRRGSPVRSIGEGQATETEELSLSPMSLRFPPG
jgi:hypothetical protein